MERLRSSETSLNIYNTTGDPQASIPYNSLTVMYQYYSKSNLIILKARIVKYNEAEHPYVQHTDSCTELIAACSAFQLAGREINYFKMY
jgi:hypothetical protein